MSLKEWILFNPLRPRVRTHTKLEPGLSFQSNKFTNTRASAKHLIFSPLIKPWWIISSGLPRVYWLTMAPLPRDSYPPMKREHLLPLPHRLFFICLNRCWGRSAILQLYYSSLSFRFKSLPGAVTPGRWELFWPWKRAEHQRQINREYYAAPNPNLFFFVKVGKRMVDAKHLATLLVHWSHGTEPNMIHKFNLRFKREDFAPKCNAVVSWLPGNCPESGVRWVLSAPLF